jgi:hypothetical protein
VKTQNVVEDLKLFEVKGQKEKKKGVLENVDTTGLSRNQKKKLKKKLIMLDHMMKNIVHI